MKRSWLPVILAVVLLGACGGGAGAIQTTSTSVPAQWGAEATAWWEASYEAQREGIPVYGRFFSMDVVVDDRVFGVVLEGREDWLNYLSNDLGVDATAQSYPLGLLVSADEMLDQRYFWWWDLLVRERVGPGGETTLDVSSQSVEGWRRSQPDRRDFDAIEGLADRYVALWNGAAGVEAAAVYAPDATMEDTLLGLRRRA